ncbi:MAG: PH domain-containing protein [Muribaculaceae bacterium]|nr:PH domain-containing protein [Muribaculaceae bacterium]
MSNEIKTVYHSRIDLWVWCVMIMGLAVIVVATIGSYWWLCLLYGALLTGLFVFGIFGCHYEICGNRLIVYQFFRPHVFPIDKIKEVGKTTGYLATAGASRKRVSIKFTDRSVMKSSMPLEISPKDRDGFIAHLKQINPAIATSA